MEELGAPRFLVVPDRAGCKDAACETPGGATSICSERVVDWIRSCVRDQVQWPVTRLGGWAPHPPDPTPTPGLPYNKITALCEALHVCRAASRRIHFGTDGAHVRARLLGNQARWLGEQKDEPFSNRGLHGKVQSVRRHRNESYLGTGGSGRLGGGPGQGGYWGCDGPL